MCLVQKRSFFALITAFEFPLVSAKDVSNSEDDISWLGKKEKCWKTVAGNFQLVGHKHDPFHVAQ